jgi:hypothetical protein
MVGGPTPGFFRFEHETLFGGVPAAVHIRPETRLNYLGRLLGGVLGRIPGWTVIRVFVPIAEFFQFFIKHGGVFYISINGWEGEQGQGKG